MTFETVIIDTEPTPPPEDWSEVLGPYKANEYIVKMRGTDLYRIKDIIAALPNQIVIAMVAPKLSPRVVAGSARIAPMSKCFFSRAPMEIEIEPSQKFDTTCSTAAVTSASPQANTHPPSNRPSSEPRPSRYQATKVTASTPRNVSTIFAIDPRWLGSRS